MTHRYETLLLTTPSLTDEQATIIEKQYNKRIEDAGGKMISFDKWGKYRLAYPVQKSDYGVYILARFELPLKHVEEVIKELRMFFMIKCNDVVMRYVHNKLDPDASLEYQRPNPMDSMRGGGMRGGDRRGGRGRRDDRRDENGRSDRTDQRHSSRYERSDSRSSDRSAPAASTETAQEKTATESSTQSEE